EAYMSGNLCRCMTYGRIKQAIKDTASQTTDLVQIFDPKREAFIDQGVS
ncbi:MAG: isoquinoline 1-oxidoreductase alpha subunit, partial [Paraglaciecola sp.]